MRVKRARNVYTMPGVQFNSKSYYEFIASITKREKLVSLKTTRSLVSFVVFSTSPTVRITFVSRLSKSTAEKRLSKCKETYLNRSHWTSFIG